MSQQIGAVTNKKQFYISMVILAVMYFVFGLVSWVNAILIPYFKTALELTTHLQSYFVTFAFYIAYFVMAIPSGLLLDKVGYKRGIMYGFMFMSLGALIFVPAALARQYWIFLAGLYCLGTGLAILQTAANPYVTIIGPIGSAARRMSIMGIFNKSAGIVAPLIFAAVVFRATDDANFALLESGIMGEMEKNLYLNELIRRVIPPYLILAGFLLLVGIFIRYSVLPEIEAEEEDQVVAPLTSSSTSLRKKRLIDYPYLIFGAFAIFVHVGTQVVAIDTIISYAGSMGISMLDAKFFPSYTLTCTIVGYILGIVLIPKVVSQKTALQFCTMLGLILTFGVIFADQNVTFLGHTANISIWFLASIGFPNALIYAGIWPLSIHGLGKLTKTGSSLLVMGLSGNAILPMIYGAIGDRYDLRMGYWVLVPCFVYLVWFAFHGHRINYWRKAKKKNILITIVVASILVSCSLSEDKSSRGDEIILESDHFVLTVGNDAVARSLVLKSNGEECLMPGESISLFSVTQERPYHNEIKLGHPNKKTTFQADTIYKEGDRLIVGFELVPYEAVIKINETPSYVGFSLEGFKVELGTYPDYLKITPPPATEICLLQLAIRDRENFGEWLNVSWDDNVAINVLGTDPYAYIDFEKRNGFTVLKASAIKEIQFEGTGAALIVSGSDKLLDNIKRLEEDFDLPRGVESRRSDLINASYYWTANVNPSNVDEHIKYAKMGGFRTMSIYYPSFEGPGGYSIIGRYEIDKRLYPNGKDDLRAMLDKIKAAGITPGVHFLHSHIGRNSQYVTPVPDYRLNLVRTFNLSKNLGMGDSVVHVEQNPAGSTMADGCRVLKVGTELISYESFTTEAPYKFAGCVRGVNQTTVNSLPKGSTIGILDVSEFGATSVYIDQRTSLQDEIAGKIANIYDAGFRFIYFDGSEGVNPPFGINVALAQYRVYKQLQPEPLFAEGAAKTHFSWHMLSGGNAFDVFRPEVLKEETKKWPVEEAPRMRQDFTRINFGWLGYWIPSETTIGTQPDMLEYVTSVAAAWDCPISIHSNLQAFATHPRTADNLEVVRRWEEVRARNWLTEEQKKQLQDVEQEHHLLLNEQNQFELVPYEQITEVAGNSRDIRAFLFQRDGAYYVIYWHISGNSNLELAIDGNNVTLFKNLNQEESIISSQDGGVIVPAGNSRYLKVSNVSKEEIIEAFENARIVKTPEA